MIEVLGSPWLPCLVLIGFAAVARRVRGSWLSPGPLAALVWSVYVSACLLLTDYKIYSSGIWIIALFVFSVLFGTVLAEGLKGRSSRPRRDRTPESETIQISQNRSFHFSLLFAIVALVGCVHLLFVSLDKFSLDLSLLDLLSLGHRWSVVRYQGELEP